MIRRYLANVAIVGLALISGLVRAETFGRHSTTLKVGVLLAAQDSAGGLRNPNPFIWYHLDQDRGTKPATWSFDNPRASTRVTAEMKNFWGGTAPAIGTSITKKNAGYWEVRLGDVSDTQLAAFDALYLGLTGTLTLSPFERQKLDKYLDQGGTLWVDVVDGAAKMDPINALTLPFGTYSNNSQNQVDTTHPLLNNPNQLDSYDTSLLSLGGTDVSGAFPSLVAPLSQGWVYNQANVWDAVLGPSNNDRIISVGHLGQGVIVVTNRGMGSWINRGLSASYKSDSNQTFNSLPAFRDSYYAAAVKLAVNILSLNSSWSSEFQGSRKTSSGAAQVTPPLLNRFRAQKFVPAKGTQPVIYKHRIIMTLASGELAALDSIPSEDLDGDGNPDDGIQDDPASGVDLIWETSGAQAKSSPVVYHSALKGDIVYVTGSDGKVRGFDLEPTNPNGFAATYTIDCPTELNNGPFMTPTIHNGLGYVAGSDNQSRPGIWVFDAESGTAVKTSRDFALVSLIGMNVPSASVTLGYVPIQDNSGGVDLVAYMPFEPNATTGFRAGFTSLWAGVRGEKPVRVDVVGSTLKIITRAASTNIPIVDAPGKKLGVKLSFVDSNTGRPLDAATVSNLVGNNSPLVNQGQNGEVSIDLANATLRDFAENGNTTVRVDYTLDWGAPTNGTIGVAPSSDVFRRAILQLPDTNPPQRRILGPLAMSSSSHLIFATEPIDNLKTWGGSVFAIREEGRGSFKVYYRWELYDKFPVTSTTSSGDQTIDYGPSLFDLDGTIQFFPPLDSFMSKPIFSAPPVVRGDTAYVTAIAGKSALPGGAAARFSSFVVALSASPQPLELVVRDVKPGFAVTQSDPGRTDLTISTPTYARTILPGSSFSYQYTEATSTEKSIGRLQLSNSAALNTGQLSDVLICNAPIQLVGAQLPGGVTIEPELGTTGGPFVPGNAAGRWNPLKWYTVIDGTSLASSAVQGSILYSGGQSVLPAFINGGGFNPASFRGLIYGLDTNVSSQDLISPISLPNGQSKMGTTTLQPRPWQKYLPQVSFLGNGDIQGSAYTLWPQFYGIRRPTDFAVRINQASLQDQFLYGVVAGDGVLASWGNNSSYGFTRADFLIVDDGRVSRIDASGNPLWSIDATESYGAEVPSSSSSTRVPLSRPSRIYPVGNNGYVIADPGADRVVRIDSDGREIRSIKSIHLDPKFAPEGYVDNEALQLRAPADVEYFTTYVKASDNQLTNPQPYELWQHYLIADTGNFRMIEVIDRYAWDPKTHSTGSIVRYTDPLTNTDTVGRGILIWHTKPEFSGKRFSYNSISKATLVLDGKNEAAYAFGFGTTQMGRRTANLDAAPAQDNVDVPRGDGGVLLYDPKDGAAQLVSSFEMPAINANILFNADGSIDTKGRPADPNRRFSGVNSVNLRYGANGVLTLMVCDNSGVYELIPNGGDWEKATAWGVNWMVPSEVYLALRRNPNDTINGASAAGFYPTYAKRLDNGDVAITNGFVGTTRAGFPFTGEALLLDGRFAATDPNGEGFDPTLENFNLKVSSIRFELPPLSGIRRLVAPVFVDRK